MEINIAIIILTIILNLCRSSNEQPATGRIRRVCAAIGVSPHINANLSIIYNLATGHGVFWTC